MTNLIFSESFLLFFRKRRRRTRRVRTILMTNFPPQYLSKQRI